MKDRIVAHAGEVMAQADLLLIGIGVSTHGFIDDARRGPLVCQNTPALTGVNLKGLLENHFHLPTIVNNDLTAHMLAEYTYGSGRGVRRFLCMALGTGLGAGVMLNGQPVRLIGGKPGDTGRIIIEPGAEETCVYGVRGSAEALIGTPHIERLAQRAYGRAVAAHEVIAAARDGSDATAVAIISQIGACLGQTLASLCSLFLPGQGRFDRGDRRSRAGAPARLPPALRRAGGGISRSHRADSGRLIRHGIGPTDALQWSRSSANVQYAIAFAPAYSTDAFLTSTGCSRWKPVASW